LHKQSVAASLPNSEIELAVHAEHAPLAVAPVEFEYFPEGQLVQTEALAYEYLPAIQLEQVSTAVAPTAPENLPATQLSQAVLTPSSALYLPALQLVQTEDANVVEYLPAPHEVHVADPIMALYVPAAHAVHAPPSGPV
jgi:hypothetical protein